MRILSAMIVALLPLAAFAQQEQPAAQRPVLKVTGGSGALTPEDRMSYCLWAGELFTVGASFCSRQQTLTTCSEVSGKRPVWVSKENDKLCDRNPSLTPQ